MYNDLIKKYVDKLTLDQIKEYANKKQIDLTEKDSIIIYNYIKKNYTSLISGNINTLLPLKDKVNSNTYDALVSLYKEACSKYL